MCTVAGKPTLEHFMFQIGFKLVPLGLILTFLGQDRRSL
jgi:hypothetical protein